MLQTMLSSFCVHLSQEELAVTQLALRLVYLFISLEFSVPPFLSSLCRTLHRALSDTSSHMHLHVYVPPCRLIPSLA